MLQTIESQEVRNLRFSHFVVSTSDGTIFASARDNNNSIHNFLITRYGDVKYQVNDHFEPLNQEDAYKVRRRAQRYYSRVPIRKINTMDFRL